MRKDKRIDDSIFFGTQESLQKTDHKARKDLITREQDRVRANKMRGLLLCVYTATASAQPCSTGVQGVSVNARVAWPESSKRAMTVARVVPD